MNEELSCIVETIKVKRAQSIKRGQLQQPPKSNGGCVQPVREREEKKLGHQDGDRDEEL